MNKVSKERVELLNSDDITVRLKNEILKEINDRVLYIITTLRKPNKSNFWFDYDNENEIGFFDPIIYSEKIGIVGENLQMLESFSDEFPTRWLWEDFEEEAANIIEEYEKNELAEQLRKKKLRIEQEQLRKSIIAQIKNKLTPEEMNYIKFR